MSPNIINWHEIAKVWPCFESMGLSPLSFDALVTGVQSPVLLVGGGTGSNVKLLVERGYEVTAVDSCEEMIGIARLERGVEILRTDGECLPFENSRFRTAIVATGVVNAATIYTPALWRLFSEIRRVLSPTGKLTTAFFAQATSLDYVFEHLRLAEAPSKNTYFVGCESLAEVQDRFLSDPSFEPELVLYIFSAFEPILQQHLSHIKRIAHRLREIGIEPSPFISHHLSFPYHDMSSEDSAYLEMRLRKLLSADVLSVASFEDTRTFTARRAS